MRVRNRARLVMWAFVLWGLFQAVGGMANHGLGSDVVCLWYNEGPDGEEHPSPMQRGDRCQPGPGGAMRTYEQQRAAQREERRDIVIGTCLLGAGALGLGSLSLQRRLSEGQSGHPWGVRTRRLRGRI
ncbi:hypothetical protein [Streptomyces sp. NRRL S-813]|uniref:hypothetical protein n=1 Tax=Streptomyces sp. NRRL S-813 TaxID=1463919 RepID=UPI000B271C94|nr:hypothetical protein [Streptomyces sp. NRRL S-813]